MAAEKWGVYWENVWKDGNFFMRWRCCLSGSDYRCDGICVQVKEKFSELAQWKRLEWWTHVCEVKWGLSRSVKKPIVLHTGGYSSSTLRRSVGSSNNFTVTHILSRAFYAGPGGQRKLNLLSWTETSRSVMHKSRSYYCTTHQILNLPVFLEFISDPS